MVKKAKPKIEEKKSKIVETGKAADREGVDFSGIEKKWQKEWEEKKVFEVKEDSKKQKYYVLEMFPYPSASGLHMGHALNYTIGDIYARFKRMNGFNVLYPMGFDAFGLPAENAAIKAGEHPKPFTDKAMENYIRQMKGIGLSYDWGRIVKTCSPEYYKWNQYFFLKFFEHGLVERKKSAVNWCPKCNTVLANEQVHGGKCWRHEDTNVEVKHLEQWFIKTTKYSEELLESIPKLRWPDRIKLMQENWIGKSYGTEIEFKINNRHWKIFTTRPDTIYGVTFMVVSAQHPKLMELVTDKQKNQVLGFLKRLKSVSEKEQEEMEKDGVFTGSYAENPLTKEKVPVYAGNFVVADYGSGMVMAVPAHDSRDWEFAKKYKISMKEVIKGGDIKKEAYTKPGVLVNSDKFSGMENGKAIEEITKYLESKKLGKKTVNYKFRDWLVSRQRYWGTPIPMIYCDKCGIKETKTKLTFDFHGEYRFKSILEGKKLIESRALDKAGRKDLKAGDLILLKHECGEEKIARIVEVNYFKNLKDFYENGKRIIPEVFPQEKISSLKDLENVYEKVEAGYLARINKFGIGAWKIELQDVSKIIPVPEKDLPVTLPEKVKFGEGNPLASAKDWINVKCPKCGKPGKRETDTMDTFFDSSWYYLRYCDNKNDKKAFDFDKVKYWMPVDQYIGGAEHACMHLIYARFFTKALRDLKLLDFDEPFIKLFNQGMLHGNDGEKMSKSKGNVILPEEVSNKYGMDTARLFLMSQASPDKDTQWSENGIEGSLRIVKRIINFFENVKMGKSSLKTESKINKGVKEITRDIEDFCYNLAIIKMRELFEGLEQEKEISKDDLEKFIKLLSPVCPHISEELWHKLGNKSFISLESWPMADEKKINLKLEQQEQAVEKTLGDIQNIFKIIKEKDNREAKKVYLYTIPPELNSYKEAKDMMQKSLNVDVEIFAVNDKNRHDPENKASKAKPGKPAIFVE